MSQEFANLCTDASSQPQDLNLRIRVAQTGNEWNRKSSVLTPQKIDAISKSRKRLADGTAITLNTLKPLQLTTAQLELRSDSALEALSTPQLPVNFVARHRLYDKLSADHYSLIQLNSPAGYGKSSLIAGWLKENHHVGAWLRLAENDNNPHQFWKRLTQTLNYLLPGSGTSSLQMLSSTLPPTIQAILPTLCRDLHRIAGNLLMDAPAVLVIDNYQEITSPIIHSRLLDLINQLPIQLQIVILNRGESPFADSQLKAGSLKLSYKDLAFTTEETSEYFKKSTARPSTLSNAIEIAEYVEGWVAGLQLIASKIDKQPHELNEILFLKNRKPLVSNLMVETFTSAHPTLQVFMLCTSLLSKFTPDLCDCMFSGELQSMMFGENLHNVSADSWEFRNSHEMIEHLEKSGQFITRCDSDNEWRRYHPMFAEMLRAELRQRNQELEMILRDRSQLWYLRQEGLSNKKLLR